MNGNCCPTCGQSVKNIKEFKISLNENSIIYKGKSIILTPMETEIIYILYTHGKPWIEKEDIYRLLYGGYNDDTPVSNPLSVHLAHLRKKFRNNGISIKIESSSYGRGVKYGGRYKLVFS